MADLEKFLTQISLPEKFGPGTWSVLTLLALDANTYAKKMHYIHIVELIFSKIPCLNPCRRDALSYLKDHPLSSYWDRRYNGEDVGMFMWLVDCHNWVNRKLDKPEVPFEIAYHFWKNQDNFVCTEGCDEKELPSPKEIKQNGMLPGFFPI